MGNQIRKLLGLSLLAIALSIVPLSISRNQQPKTILSTALPLPELEIQYQSYSLDESVVHTLLIPKGNRFSVTPAISQKLSIIENFTKKHQAIAAINGGFFDPQNQKTTSYVIQQGNLVGDPRLNERLINNPNNAPYLDKILNRTEFRRYSCGATIDYDLAFHREPFPTGCRLIDALGGGPRLLPKQTTLAEGFLDFANGTLIKDALGSTQQNARSAVGITSDGSILLVMVAQKPEAPSNSGMSLTTLATFMKTLGVEKAMNLDGGSSSSLLCKGKTFYGKVDAKGNYLKRPVKSVLLVQEN